MKLIIQTPMRGEQIPSSFTRTLAKIYNQLHNQLLNQPLIYQYNHGIGGEDDITAFLFCADQAMKNVCFSQQDKDSIRKWHENIQGCQGKWAFCII